MDENKNRENLINFLKEKFQWNEEEEKKRIIQHPIVHTIEVNDNIYLFDLIKKRNGNLMQIHFFQILICVKIYF